MTGREASKLLKTTEPNFSQYMSRHYPKHKPKRKSKKKAEVLPQIGLDKSGEPVLNVQLGSKSTNLEIGTVAWKKMMLNLLSTLVTDEKSLDFHEQIKLSRTLTDLLKFEFSHNVPDIPKETVQIDDKMAKELIDQVMKDHDTWCPYRSEFIDRKDKSQSQARMESAEPSLVE
jgi:hypothetical protein